MLGTKNVLDAALAGNIRVVFASSSSVYGNTREVPITENAEKRPANPYGQTKLDAEAMAAEYADKGLEVIGLRYFNVYGPGQGGPHAGVVAKFLEAGRLKKPLAIYGAGEQVRDFVFVGDVAGANLAVMKHVRTKSGFYNIGTQVGTSILDLARTASAALGRVDDIAHMPALSGDVDCSIADMSCTHKTFGWRHAVSLKEGLQQTVRVQHRKPHGK